MSAADKDPDKHSADADPPLTVELLADLQAGLLDDATAARIRSRVRSDPQAQQILRALNRVRRDVAAMGADPAWGPAARPAVVDSISAALRSARPNSSPGAAHAARPHVHPVRMIAGAAGLCAVATAIGVGAVVDAPPPAPSAPTTAQHITVSKPAPVIPLSRPQVLDLLHHTRTMARPEAAGRSVPAYVLPERPRLSGVHAGAGRAADRYRRSARRTAGDTRGHARQTGRFAVAPHCSAADTGLLASTVVPRA